MRLAVIALTVLIPFAAFAEDDSAADLGEKVFGKCQACHRLESPNEVVVKGGRTGPNLLGIVGRRAGSLEDFNYSPAMQAVLALRLDWDEAMLAEYLADPTAWIRKVTKDDTLRSKMTFKLPKEEDAKTVAAYLARMGAEHP